MKVLLWGVLTFHVIPASIYSNQSAHTFAQIFRNHLRGNLLYKSVTANIIILGLGCIGSANQFSRTRGAIFVFSYFTCGSFMREVPAARLLRRLFYVSHSRLYGNSKSVEKQQQDRENWPRRGGGRASPFHFTAASAKGCEKGACVGGPERRKPQGGK